MSLRQAVSLLFVAPALALAVQLAGAQSAFPTKPVVIVAPAGPGGSPDMLARVIGPPLAERLGQSVVIENKPGGGGNIAAGQVAHAAPDGYTLLIATDPVATNQTLFKKRPYDALKSFTSVIQAVNAPQVLAVRADLPIHDLQALIAAAKAAPGKLAMASPAIGTTGQLGILMLQKQAGISLNPVVYKSAQPALTDVLGGHADGILVTLAAAMPFIKDGRLRAIAVSTSTRSPALPAVKTFVEQGMPQYAFGSWQGFVAPAGTPPEAIRRLNSAMNEVLQMPSVRKVLEEQAFDVVGGTPKAFDQLIADSVAHWAGVIRENGLEGNQ